MNFVGSKGGAGVAQWIVSTMPYHTHYVEAFLGRGVVLDFKKPASQLNMAIEIDPSTIADYQRRQAESETATGSRTLIFGDALTILPILATNRDWLIYCDPPYLGTTRSCNRDYYRHEMRTAAEHERFLSIASSIDANVMISGYAADLYDRHLRGWRTSTFWTVNRAGKRVEEKLWMNFDPPQSLHDTRFFGNGFTDRQRVKRKVMRWTRKLATMPAGERQAIMDALLNIQEPKTEMTLLHRGGAL